MTMSPIWQHSVQAWRGTYVENRHFIHAAVVGQDSGLQYKLGNAQRRTFIRSTAKPLQAVAVLLSGAASAQEMSAAELAFICSSHSGEPAHVELAQSLMDRLGVKKQQLHCGTQQPYDRSARSALRAAGQQPSVLHHNCSGKHLGMLAMAQAMDTPIDKYWQLDHPVQQQMLTIIASLSAMPIEQISVAIDGCGVPAYRMPLERLARAYLEWCSPHTIDAAVADCCRTLYDSIVKHPFYLAGSNRFDTRLIEVTDGRWMAKMGADGVLAIASRQAQQAIALKSEDGSLRAVYAAAVEVLVQLDELNSSQRAELTFFHKPKLYNQTGLEVGHMEPDFTLQQA